MTRADINYRKSGGAFDQPVRLLQTMTIHHNAKVNRYFVTDDWNNAQTVSAGHKSPEEAATLNRAADERRFRTW